MEKILSALVEAAPIIKQLVQEDCAMVLTDFHHFLLAEEGERVKLPPHMKKGAESDISPIIQKVIDERNPYYSVVHMKEYDIYNKGAVIPIMGENNEVIGVFSFIRNATNEEKAKSASLGLSNAISEVNDALQAIVEGAEKLSEMMVKIVKETDLAKNDLNESYSAVSLIESTAKKTNMLGINASIEVARVGEAGKGFGVVAQEMSNLSKSSSEMSKKISNSLNKLRNNMESTLRGIKDFGVIASEQSNAINEIQTAMQMISESSQELLKIIES